MKKKRPAAKTVTSKNAHIVTDKSKAFVNGTFVTSRPGYERGMSISVIVDGVPCNVQVAGVKHDPVLRIFYVDFMRA